MHVKDQSSTHWKFKRGGVCLQTQKHGRKEYKRERTADQVIAVVLQLAHSSAYYPASHMRGTTALEQVMALKDVIGEYAFVSKVDVSDLEASSTFYGKTLKLTLDDKFSTPTWRQFRVFPRLAIGLNLNPSGVGTAGAVATFVVDNIAQARAGLLEQGVKVGPVIDVGHGVQLAFFKDPDGNSLGLRQNPPGHPKAAQVGGA
jgi:glyoxylase I family protein